MLKSRKFVIAIMVLIMAYTAPIIYAKLGVDVMVTMSVIALFAGVAAGYHIVQGKIDLAGVKSGEASK